MKNRTLFFMIFVPLFSFAQLNESFLDGNFINNPKWEGTTANFEINNSLQLQSQAKTTSISYLFTPSVAIENASWEAWVKITYTTSSSNYASIYIVSDRMDASTELNGYFVQIGGANDEVSLYLQEGTKKTKIIDGIDKRTDGNPVELKIKVTRDHAGNFTLYSKLNSESEYTNEGSVQNETVKASSYFGLLYSNTSTTGSDYYFDDILVTGTKMLDLESPSWNSIKIEQPNKLKVSFSEAMDCSTATYNVDNGMGNPEKITISENNTCFELTFKKEFETGKIYKLQTSGLKDVSGNELTLTEKEIGIIEPIEFGDLVINEIMVENPENSEEYIEFYNNSEKVIDVTDLLVTTRKTDETLNTGVKFPAKTTLLPHSYLALCTDAETVKKYYNCTQGCNIVSTDSWSSLNNESSTIVLTNATKDTIYDELTYNSNWHHVLIKNVKGVALEKINPDLNTQDPLSWHSAASELNYGTPGYKNSQFRDLSTDKNIDKTFWTEPEVFSPDNNGIDDVCIIHYKTNSSGFIANVAIFNAAGVKVQQLISNSLLSSEGYFSWDGKTHTGKNANIGVYVVYIEIFNPENGQRIREKLPVVVSSI